MVKGSTGVLQTFAYVACISNLQLPLSRATVRRAAGVKNDVNVPTAAVPPVATWRSALKVSQSS